MRLFWDFPHEEVGFTMWQWDEVPRGDKAIIRDYYLNHKDRELTSIYGFWDTIHQVRKAEKQYELEKRPCIDIQLCSGEL